VDNLDFQSHGLIVKPTLCKVINELPYKRFHVFCCTFSCWSIILFVLFDEVCVLKCRLHTYQSESKLPRTRLGILCTL
jgi:hypothetical protein